MILDEACPGFNTSEGEPLFDADGGDSDALKRILGFLEEYQTHVRSTQAFMAEINRMGLLEPKQLQRTDGAGQPGQVMTGLWMVNEDKLKALPAEQAQALLKSGALCWIYAHLLSLVNLDRLNARVQLRLLAQPPAA